MSDGQGLGASVDISNVITFETSFDLTFDLIKSNVNALIVRGLLKI